MTADAAIPGAPAAGRTVERVDHAFALVESWLFSGAMTELLDLFDGHTDRGDWRRLDEELPEWLDPLLSRTDPSAESLSEQQVEVLRRALAIEQTAAGHFNFRTSDGSTYRERAQAAHADFSPETRAEVLRLTDALGLVSPRPPRSRRYARTLVLGGGYRSALFRARYAAQLQASGVVLGEVDFLGSPRFLLDEPPERPVVEPYAPGAADEFDLMIGAVRTEFGLEPAEVTFLCGCSSAEHTCPNWSAGSLPRADQTPPAFTHERRVALADADGQAVGSVYSASTGRPPLRPDTADTLRLWARYAQPRLGQRVLVVTTQVFVPFQAFDGIRRLYLPHGVDLDTVGYGAEWKDRPQTAEYLLQETLSAIRSARRLLVDAAEVLVKEGSGT
ncbi:hypothetical protein [Plantactinospora soyae]|uniref:Uncharacterized protein n=1 Tax=Plantactinospora soyae TaxID=1544732 RepID=A0A927QWW3_9ACTN|nr:hypothetical protein [Plantactinospora soyae]MBE1484843.1 hypothetical protein [Plantactinospora soyae]